MTNLKIGKTKTGYKITVTSKLGYKLGTKYFKTKKEAEAYKENF